MTLFFFIGVVATALLLFLAMLRPFLTADRARPVPDLQKLQEEAERRMGVELMLSDFERELADGRLTEGEYRTLVEALKNEAGANSVEPVLKLLETEIERVRTSTPAALFCTLCGTERSGEGRFCVECGAPAEVA